MLQNGLLIVVLSFLYSLGKALETKTVKESMTMAFNDKVLYINPINFYQVSVTII